MLGSSATELSEFRNRESARLSEGAVNSGEVCAGSFEHLIASTFGGCKSRRDGADQVFHTIRSVAGAAAETLGAWACGFHLLALTEFFNGMIPQELVRDFIGVNQTQSRLEGRFGFGVHYRFVSEETSDDVEARLAVPTLHGHKTAVHARSVLDRLAFSRVGRTLKNDQALVYVENRRRDGTGAGFLVWFHRREEVWELFDTEVVWTMRDSADDAARP